MPRNPTAPRRDDPPPRPIDSGSAEHCAEILKAVAHPLRLRIVALLCREELNVNALAEELGVGQAIVSQQLRILRLRRLVVATRAQGFVRYRLAEPQLKVLVGCVGRCAQR